MNYNVRQRKGQSLFPGSNQMIPVKDLFILVSLSLKHLFEQSGAVLSGNKDDKKYLPQNMTGTTLSIM